MLVLVCAGGPMFAGLDQWEMRSDEAIYSYAAQRILETGEWLTPRSIPGDEPFYEKPPLKFWLLAGAIKLGALPASDAGLRGIDALASVILFVYLYLIGTRLAGPVAGVVGVFALFWFDAVLVEHGLRSNNMEAPLMLAYAAAVFHALQWAEGEPARRGRHAAAVAAWFAFGFLIKFVAALFLPIVVVLTVACRPGGVRALLAAWRQWTLAALAALALIAPWFIYESFHAGREFWQILLEAHVLQRFAGVLHPEHLHPWHYYLTWLWSELGREHLRAAWALGAAALVAGAVVRRDWRVRAVLLWWVVPFVLISAGTSKLFHYAYPFLPPIALGTGVAVAWAVDALMEERWLPRWRWAGLGALGTGGAGAARVLTGLGTVAFVLGAWAVLAGPFTLELAGVRLFRSAVLWRPALIGVVLWVLAGQGARVLRPVALIAMLWVLVPEPYTRHLAFLTRTDHPLPTAAACVDEVARLGGLRPGVYQASGELHHAYFFYLRRFGFTWHEQAGPDELQRRLEVPGRQTPVMIARADYERLGGRVPSSAPAPVATSTGWPPLAPQPPLADGFPPAILFSDDIVLLFPRPYDACVDLVMRDAVGATRLPAVRTVLTPPL